MAAVKPVVKSFVCPNCGAPVTIRAIGVSLSVACGSCGSVIDANNEHHRVLATYQQKQVEKPAIPLGSKGVLFKIKWEVVGFIVRRDVASDFRWCEYLLFNPYHGYRWLLLQNGHWSFVTAIRDEVNRSGNRNRAFWDKNSFRIFHRGEAEVVYVLGEFYWQVAVGEKVAVEDYINASGLISSESSEQEQTWSFSTYVTQKEIQKSFSGTDLPRAIGVAPNQPVPPSLDLNKHNKFLFIMIALMTVAQLFFALRTSNRVILTKDFTVNSKDAFEFTSDPFELRGWPDNVELVIQTQVNQGWIEFDATLVNEADNTSHQFPLEVSYYSGIDGGERWSEGSTSGSAAISDVPNGTYRFLLEAVGEPNGPSGVTATSEVKIYLKRGVSTYGNYVFALIMILLPLVVLAFRRYNFEAQRWSDSDFNPYMS